MGKDRLQLFGLHGYDSRSGEGNEMGTRQSIGILEDSCCLRHERPPTFRVNVKRDRPLSCRSWSRDSGHWQDPEWLGSRYPASR